MVAPALGLPSGSTRTGIACMVAAAALITLNDALAKLLAERLPVGQIIGLRAFAALLPVGYAVYRAGGRAALRVRDPKSQLLRSVLFTMATFCLVGGLVYLPLPLVVFLAGSSPLFVTLFAPLMLAEKVGWRRWSAVLVGFGGVYLIASPTGDSTFGLVLLLPMGAALTSGIADLVTRRMSATESSTAIVVCSTVGIGLGGLATAPFGWVMPDAAALGLLLCAGLLQGAGFLCLVESFRHGEATVVAPFRYTTLLWGLLLGAAIWGDLPDGSALLGAAAILLSTVYVYHREAVRARQAGGQ